MDTHAGILDDIRPDVEADTVHMKMERSVGVLAVLEWVGFGRLGEILNKQTRMIMAYCDYIYRGVARARQFFTTLCEVWISNWHKYESGWWTS